MNSLSLNNIIFFYFVTEKWENHSEIELVRWIQARNKDEDVNNVEKIYTSSEDENDEEESVETQKHQKKISKMTSDSSDDSSEITSEESEISYVANKFEALSTDM